MSFLTGLESVRAPGRGSVRASPVWPCRVNRALNDGKAIKTLCGVGKQQPPAGDGCSCLLYSGCGSMQLFLALEANRL